MTRRTKYLAGVLALAGLAGLAGLAAGEAGRALPATQVPPTSTGGARLGAGGEGAALAFDRWQPKRLPPLPTGMTLDLIRSGDSVFHGKGGCVTCHGPDAFGVPNSGSGLTLGLHFIPLAWAAIDSLVTAGIPEALTRSTIAMPGRGASQNLTPDETRRVAAYVWAIAQVADEPWPGGHRTHATTAAAPTAAPNAARTP